MVSSVVMSAVLIRMRETGARPVARDGRDHAAESARRRRAQNVTLMIANDADGSLTAMQERIALPKDANARAHVILQHLIAAYARPGVTPSDRSQ